MTKRVFKQSLVLWLLSLLSVSVVIFQQVWRARPPVTQNISFAFNEGKPILTPRLAKVFSVGYPHAFSSLLWLRFLQNTPTVKVPAGERSWIYYDFLTISRVDPDFLPVYTMGSLYLSVINEDYAGAEEIMLAGLDRFPHDIKILGNLAYHYQFERGDSEKAGPYFVRAAREPGAPFLFAIMASNYLKKSGSVEDALIFLRETAAKAGSGMVRGKIEEKILKLESGGK